MSDPSCIFCKVAAGTIPATVVHSGERLMAFRDIDPKAPVHILVIPREHIASLDEADERHHALLGEILLLARGLARDEGIAAGGYRTVINTGADGGQSVHHLHLHLLGGRGLGWPPG
jgi:histidine triad (HIT) family protein